MEEEERVEAKIAEQPMTSASSTLTKYQTLKEIGDGMHAYIYLAEK